MNGKTFPYKSAQYQMQTTVLQSMFNNMGNRIRKMNMVFEFNSMEEKQMFNHKWQEQKDKINDDFNNTEFEQGSSAQKESNSSKPISSGKKGQKENYLIKIDQNFQISILLRQKFMTRLNSIGNRLNVKFTVVPNRVKIQGRSRDRVDEAQDQYRQLRENLYIQLITRYGQQIYQSKYYKRILEQHNVYIIQVLKKYYFWYNKEKTNDPHNILVKVFSSLIHKFYPLTQNKQRQKKLLASGKTQIYLGISNIAHDNKRTVINNLIMQMKVNLFQGIFEKEINKMSQNPDMHVELSQDSHSLVLHLQADQQFQIQFKNLDELYHQYRQLFLTFPSQNQLEKFKQSLEDFNKSITENKFKKNKILQNPSTLGSRIIWKTSQRYCIISYKQYEKDLDSQVLQQHILVKFVQTLPQDLLCFQIFLQYSLQGIQDQPFFKPFTYEKAKGGSLIGCRDSIMTKYELLFKFFIQNKFSKEYNDKKRGQKLKKNQQSVSLSIDISKPLNQSSYMIDNSKNNQSNILNQSILGKSIQGQNVLPKNITNTTMSRFQNYATHIIISPQDTQKQYSNLQNIKISQIPWKNAQLLKIMKQSTQSEFKAFRVKIPNAFKINLDSQTQDLLEKKPELILFNKLVTVFTKESKQNLYNKQKSIKITKLEKNYSITEGFLVETKLCYILDQNQSQLPYGRYQIISYVKKVV